MKKLLIIMIVLLFTGCSAKESPVKETGTTEEILTDIITEITGEPVAEYFFADADIETGINPEHLLSEEIDKDADVIEIREKLFIAQTNDIYLNTEDYLGKTIKYQGIFDSYYWDETDLTYHNVIRYGPGCCGIDDNAGFEVIWDNEYPEQGDWVEVVGVLEIYEEFDYEYLRLQIISIEVLEERGAEYVFM